MKTVERHNVPRAGKGPVQTPSTGLRHPSFGGRCRKAMLGVWCRSCAEAGGFPSFLSSQVGVVDVGEERGGGCRTDGAQAAAAGLRVEGERQQRTAAGGPVFRPRTRHGGQAGAQASAGGKGQWRPFRPSTGHEINIAEPKPNKRLSSTSLCSQFNC